MKNYYYIKGILLTAAGAIGWGISGICSQYLFAEYNLDSGWLTAIRMIFSGIVLLSIAAVSRSSAAGDSPADPAKEKGRIFSVLQDKSDRLWLIAFAILGLLLCQYSFLAAIKYSNSATSTVLQSLNVIMMAIVMALWNRSKLSAGQTAAVVLAVLGTWLIVTHGVPTEMVLSPSGLIFGLLSAVGVVSYTLLSRAIIQKWGNMIITGWGMLIGGIVLGIGLRAWVVPQNLDFTAVLMIAIIVIVGTAGGFSLFLQGVKYIGPVKATLIGCLEPATATVLSALCFHTQFGLIEIAGFCIIMATVFLSMRETSQ